MTRILHIVAGMNRGGVETWLMHVLRTIDRRRFQMDFLVHTRERCDYDQEIAALGSRIIYCDAPTQPVIYARNLYSILKNNTYDVVHSHVHFFSGWTLLVARLAGVHTRISHSHNDTSPVQLNSNNKRKFYFRLMRWLIEQNANVTLSASQKAATALFGPKYEETRNHRLLYYGIDLEPFSKEIDRKSIRQTLNIPESAFVVGHVGRFEAQKNHSFLLRVFREILNIEKNAYCLLIGRGSLQQQMEHLANDLELANRVIFAGVIECVPEVMLGAMDCFLLPSIYEGLGIVLIEAQAAGLPCVYSSNVPPEAAIVPSLVTTLSLDTPEHMWAEAVLVTERSLEVNQKTALNLVKASKFNIETSITYLTSIYDKKHS